MARPGKILFILCIGAALIMTGTLVCFAQAQPVRARIGVIIKSGDQVMRAKGKDSLKAGDSLRIYVQPDEGSYLYVVHADPDNVTLLKMVDRSVPSSQWVLPGEGDLYEVDGQSPIETFTIICSPEELKEVAALAGTKMPYEKWTALVGSLVKRGQIDLSQKSEKPFPIAGNTRGEVLAGGRPERDCEAQVFSGNTILVKQYEFTVKK